MFFFVSYFEKTVIFIQTVFFLEHFFEHPCIEANAIQANFNPVTKFRV